MKCVRCHQDNPSHAKFCLECGTPLTPTYETGPRGQSYADLQHALTEAQEQQTATAEILRVISSSPTDVQPVFNIIAESAARLCDAYDAWVARLDGDVLRVVAHYGPIAIADAVPVIRGTVAGRTVIDRRTLHVTDLQAAMDEFPEGSAFAKRLGQRTVVGVPLLREGVPIGSMQVRRAEVRPFTDTQISLLETFAHQAVIAIENVRLLQELQTRNAELTESLEQLTATAEILRVISSSPTDLQPVMEAVAENAARVCGATDSSIYRLEGEHMRLEARYGSLRRSLTIGDTVPVTRGTLVERIVRDRRTIHIEDLMAVEAEFPITVARNRQAGSLTRTILATPLLREGTALGVIFIARGPETKPFSAKQIGLLEIFANQAVIAIEALAPIVAARANHDGLSTLRRIRPALPTRGMPKSTILSENGGDAKHVFPGTSLSRPGPGRAESSALSSRADAEAASRPAVQPALVVSSVGMAPRLNRPKGGSPALLQCLELADVKVPGEV
jgi:two-component system, NtrC family, sensor kinase